MYYCLCFLSVSLCIYTCNSVFPHAVHIHMYICSVHTVPWMCVCVCVLYVFVYVLHIYACIHHANHMRSLGSRRLYQHICGQGQWLPLALSSLVEVVDHSGRVFTKQAPTLRDVACNSEVGIPLYVTITSCSRTCERASARSKPSGALSAGVTRGPLLQAALSSLRQVPLRLPNKFGLVLGRLQEAGRPRLNRYRG